MEEDNSSGTPTPPEEEGSAPAPLRSPSLPSLAEMVLARAAVVCVLSPAPGAPPEKRPCLTLAEAVALAAGRAPADHVIAALFELVEEGVVSEGRSPYLYELLYALKRPAPQ